MKAQDLFGAVVRTVGLLLVAAGVMTFFAEPVVGLAFAAVGIAVIGQVNWIVEVCYAEKWSLPRLTFRSPSAPAPNGPAE